MIKTIEIIDVYNGVAGRKSANGFDKDDRIVAGLAVSGTHAGSDA
jgi:hypothetical protein